MADNTILAKLDGIKEKYASISEQITDPEVMSDMKRYIQLNKEYKELGPIVEAADRYRRAGCILFPPLPPSGHSSAPGGGVSRG